MPTCRSNCFLTSECKKCHVQGVSWSRGWRVGAGEGGAAEGEGHAEDQRHWAGGAAVCSPSGETCKPDRSGSSWLTDWCDNRDMIFLCRRHNRAVRSRGWSSFLQREIRKLKKSIFTHNHSHLWKKHLFSDMLSIWEIKRKNYIYIYVPKINEQL